MAGVLVIGEVGRDGVVSTSFEAVTAGSNLAAAFGEPILGALIGGGADVGAQFGCGFSKLYLASNGSLIAYDASTFVSSAISIIEACAPTAVVMPHTTQTRDWVPQLAARIDAALVLDCVGVTAECGNIIVNKPVCGGAAMASYFLNGAVNIVTIRKGAFAPCSVEGACPHHSVSVQGDDCAAVRLLEEEAAEGGSGHRLKDAKVIVAGGRGIGGPGNWHYIENAATALEAAVGCSRPVADSGWVRSTHQVGLSGTMVSPDLYIAVGISGAVQHLAGIGAARTVVAINNDPDADIFMRANFGVVGDFREVLPAFVERIKQLRIS